MVAEYLGRNNKSPHYRIVRRFIASRESFVNLAVSDVENLNNIFLAKLIVKYVAGKIGFAGLDNIFGNQGREDIVEITEDAFIRCLSTYVLQENDTIIEELNRKIKDENYKIDSSKFKKFNGYLSKVVGMDITKYLRKPGKYAKNKVVNEEYTVYNLKDKDEDNEIVQTERIIKGEFVVDRTLAPKMVSVINDTNSNNYDNEDIRFMRINKDVAELQELEFNYNMFESGIDRVIEDCNNEALRNELMAIINNLTDEERILLRNFPSYCYLMDEKQLKQVEIAKIINVNQGTVSKYLNSLCFKISTELLRHGYSFEEGLIL